MGEFALARKFSSLFKRFFIFYGQNMELSKKTTGNNKAIYKGRFGKRNFAKKEPKIVWKQVFPKDAEQRIQRAFEMLLTSNPNFPL